MFKKVFTTVTVGLSFAAVANASTVNDLINWPTQKDVIFSDENRERILVDDGTLGVIDVGDVIEGILAIDQLFTVPFPAGTPVTASSLENSAGNSEIGGYFQVVVTSKVLIAPATITTPAQYAFTFGSTAVDGAIIYLYEDTTAAFSSHYDLDSGIASSIASVTDGEFFASLGLGSAGNFYIGQGSDTIPTGSAVARVGDVFFALDRISAGVHGDALGADALVLDTLSFLGGAGEVIGASEIGPKIPGSPWSLASNTQVSMRVIPVPAAVWGGMALLGGMGIVRRVRR
jgi:hypothetical protein